MIQVFQVHFKANRPKNFNIIRSRNHEKVYQ
jgi:hypothetical protein